MGEAKRLPKRLILLMIQNASPNRYCTTIMPAVQVHEVMQGLHRQQDFQGQRPPLQLLLGYGLFSA